MLQSKNCHEIRFPEILNEVWNFVLVYPKEGIIIENRLHTIKSLDKEVSAQCNFQSNLKILLQPNFPPGTYKMEFRGYCNGYVGLDVIETITVTFLPNPNEKLEIHPEDEKVMQDRSNFFDVKGFNNKIDNL